MSPELTKRLVARHPALLAMPEDSVISQRGVECGDGWYDLIDEALTAIEKHSATVNAKPPAILQVKQKIDDLRAVRSSGKARQGTAHPCYVRARSP